MFQTDRAQQKILIENKLYSQKEIIAYYQQNEDNLDIKSELFSFLKDWFDQSHTVIVHTSGSTDNPKPLSIEKNRMIQSACLTCSFLKLQPEDTALLCMPLKYIGAKMMVVRALVAGLNLFIVEPSNQPLKQLTIVPTFVAMTPTQVFTTLEQADGQEQLQKINHVIIGGSALNKALEKKLSNFHNAVWSTYGMTETLSHIALRKINGKDASDWYIPFKGITISLSKQNTLIIKAPMLCNETLFTNDIAEFDKHGRFRIIGRLDNVINSGGIKIQIESVECILKEHLLDPLIITSIPDDKFGEILVILIKQYIDNLLEICRTHLPVYWRPKYFILVQSLPITETGKPNRAFAKKLACNSSKHLLKY